MNLNHFYYKPGMEIKDISMVSLLTNELVHHYLDKDKYPNLTSYFLRLLSSKQLSNFSQDETNSFFSMEKDQTLDTRCRLSLLFKRLKALRPAGFRERILYIICELRQDNSIAIPTKQLESLPSLASSFFETELNVIDYARDLIFTFQGIESRNFSNSSRDFLSKESPTIVVSAQKVKNVPSWLFQFKKAIVGDKTSIVRYFNLSWPRFISLACTRK